MAQYALTGGNIDIRIQEPADLGVVVTALQVVQSSFFVIHIPAVAERVEIAQRIRQRAGAGKLLAPAIVSIFYYGIVITVNQTDNVVLPVADIVVIRTVVIDRRYIAARIVTEQ